ncbi:unnamed protein product [Linum tenue]|uniref:Uncharacterized protein n=1 Tax=Linum tenue TaxID=586396 RepID=A0AAV0L665_9ROSI|nr:unnamed protein product [Linum tenue]
MLMDRFAMDGQVGSFVHPRLRLRLMLSWKHALWQNLTAPRRLSFRTVNLLSMP